MSVVPLTTSLRDAVVEAGARWASGQYQLVRLVADLDASGEWAADGAPTCAHWVADALDIEVCTAREWLRVGAALKSLRVIDAAFASGDVSYSKVRALTRVAMPDTESELCELATRIPDGHLACALSAWQARRETPAETEKRQHEARSVAWRVDVDGTVVGAFRLPPHSAATLTNAVDTRVRRRRASADASGWPSIAQQRADALVALVEDGGGPVVNEIVLHVRGDGCTLDDGTPIAGSIVERIAPDAFLRALIHDAERHPINASGRHRHPTLRQKRVVRERDRVCVDCGATDFLEFDHDPPFEVSKRTIVDELRPRCVNCHHRHHREHET
jgi:hypothetical protein